MSEELENNGEPLRKGAILTDVILEELVEWFPQVCCRTVGVGGAGERMIDPHELQLSRRQSCGQENST